MDDLIYKQTALDAINSWRRDYPLDLQEPIDDCWNAVKELPAVEPEPHWIPCRKKLPEKDNYYLVQALMNNDIFVASWQGCYWNVKTPIVAWMTLPEPYKGGDAE